MRSESYRGEDSRESSPFFLFNAIGVIRRPFTKLERLLWTRQRRLCQAISNPARRSKVGEQEGKVMKSRFTTAIAVILFTAALAMAADGTWTGWITDDK